MAQDSLRDFKSHMFKPPDLADCAAKLFPMIRDQTMIECNRRKSRDSFRSSVETVTASKVKKY